MKELVSVAIDGPAGAGKSTIAKEAAKFFNFIYVDTGAIYRTVGLAVRRNNIEPRDEESISKLLPHLDINMAYSEQGIQCMYLNGENVSSLIRTPEISMYASAVSSLPAVRSFLLEMQRSMAKYNNVIMDGRDIGTVVLPDARLKIFLTASPEARANRRYIELQQKGESVDFESVLQDLNKRDFDDSNRAIAPLKQADDAVLVDTTELSLEESISEVKRLISEILVVDNAG